MKKIEKMIHQIIRFRGKIEAFLVSIDLFDIPSIYIDQVLLKFFQRRLHKVEWIDILFLTDKQYVSSFLSPLKVPWY